MWCGRRAYDFDLIDRRIIIKRKFDTWLSSIYLLILNVKLFINEKNL